MDMDQVQRHDIYNLEINTMSQDTEDRTISSPYLLSLMGLKPVCNNWIVTDNYYTKKVLPNTDSLIFNVKDERLLNKLIKKLILNFDCEVSNGSPLLSDVGVNDEYAPMNKYLSKSMSVSLLDLFPSIDFVELFTNGFELCLKFDGNNSSASITLSNIGLNIEFSSALEHETNVLNNRCISYDSLSDKPSINYNYSSLSDKPRINNVELKDNKNSSDLGLTSESSHKFKCIYNGTYAKAYANDYYVYITLVEGQSHDFTTEWVSLWANSISEEYIPLSIIYFKANGAVNNSNEYWAKIDIDGKVYIRSVTATSATLHGGVMYPRQDMLP